MESNHEALRDERVRALKASPAYLLAFEDIAFLRSPELRAARLQLELLKPELLQQSHGVESTIVVFGSARIPEPVQARRALEEAEKAAWASPSDGELKRRAMVAGRLADLSRYYEEARKFSRIVSGMHQVGARCDFVITTGGGPGIMEAANRGAADIGSKSIGHNITLPHEQEPNPYVTPELCFRFHYFALRKMHFMLRAKALVAFPGGYGTLDELFEALTLVQTGKVPAIPIVLFGRAFWERVINFGFLESEGVISPGDRSLFHFAETAGEAWGIIESHYRDGGEVRPYHPQSAGGEQPGNH